jgi:ABC-type nitrate/sulfonate/bicarbonate transport system substrate-binding protein
MENFRARRALADYVIAMASRGRQADKSIRRLVGTFRLGYVPLVDAAPLLVAEALGLFAERGLAVELSAELGWGSIREKLVYGELDGAHAPGPLVFSIVLGTDSKACPVSTDLVLSLQGNGITLSRRFWDRGVRDIPTLRAMVRNEAPHKPAFAVVARFSSHHFLLRRWLRSAELDPDRHVRIVVLPPPLVAEHLKEGQIDGFCAGEPWNSAAALSGDGWVVATSLSLAPKHPEKVLLVRDQLILQQPEAYSVLRTAIGEACRFCDQPENRRSVADILHAARIFPVSKEVLLNSLVGPFDTGVADLDSAEPFLVFHKDGANEASEERAKWCLETVMEAGALKLDSRTRKLCLDAFLDERQRRLPSSARKAPHSIAN